MKQCESRTCSVLEHVAVASFLKSHWCAFSMFSLRFLESALCIKYLWMSLSEVYLRPGWYGHRISHLAANYLVWVCIQLLYYTLLKKEWKYKFSRSVLQRYACFRAQEWETGNLLSSYSIASKGTLLLPTMAGTGFTNAILTSYFSSPWDRM